MICIRDKFSQNIGRQVSSSVIWDHLGTMYDMQALVRRHDLAFLRGLSICVCLCAHARVSGHVCVCVSGLIGCLLRHAARVRDPAIPKHREELLTA